jgi:phosphomannomutase
MVQMLNLLTLKGRPLSDLCAPLRKYRKSGEINLRVSDKAAVIAALGRRFDDGDIDRLDGLTVNYDGWWFNLRPSNTEPVLRLNLEAETQPDLDGRIKEVLDAVRAADPQARRIE